MALSGRPLKREAAELKKAKGKGLPFLITADGN